MNIPLVGVRRTLLLALAGSVACIGGVDGEKDLCESPTAILDARGVNTGFERCADGAIRRLTAETCDTTIEAESCAGTEDDRHCEVDADCTAAPAGRCLSQNDLGFGLTACGCVYPCATDSDCEAGQVCVCGGVIARVATY